MKNEKGLETIDSIVAKAFQNLHFHQNRYFTLNLFLQQIRI